MNNIQINSNPARSETLVEQQERIKQALRDANKRLELTKKQYGKQKTTAWLNVKITGTDFDEKKQVGKIKWYFPNSREQKNHITEVELDKLNLLDMSGIEQAIDQGGYAIVQTDEYKKSGISGSFWVWSKVQPCDDNTSRAIGGTRLEKNPLACVEKFLEKHSNDALVF